MANLAFDDYLKDSVLVENYYWADPARPVLFLSKKLVNFEEKQYFIHYLKENGVLAPDAESKWHNWTETPNRCKYPALYPHPEEMLDDYYELSKDNVEKAKSLGIPAMEWPGLEDILLKKYREKHLPATDFLRTAYKTLRNNLKESNDPER